ncbi:2TM domain-containing protein [Polaribacter gochangensis]|uniref:2TM domain-containing protein n=1 Tax=Polaribacter gochangensis TaxID=3252903 RepID=UPI00390487B3
MSQDKNSSTLDKIKKDVILCIKLTVVFGILFVIINQQFTIKGVGIIFLFSAMYSFGLGLGNGMINEYLNTKWSWVDQTNQRLTAGIIATIFYTIIIVLLIHYVQYVLILGNNFEEFFFGELFLVHVFTILGALAIAVFFHARGFMINWKASQTQKSNKQEIVAKTETAKFESLKNQIDPHFLFNSLNVLTSLIGENPKQAERFTTKLSKVYRYVLEQRNKELIPLSEELQFARTYMELLQMRFEDAIQFDIPSEISNEELKIVPLSLQLLLENAVKHNVVSSSKPLQLRIFEENGALIIENNVNHKEAIGKSTKIGLRNITDRYFLLTKRSVEITNDNIVFRVSLPLLTKNNNIMYTKEIENNSYVRAVEKVEKLKEFYQNLASYCIVIPFLVFINLYTSPQFHWFWFPMFGWGIGVIFHGLDVYNYNPFLGRNWESKKIKELMEENDDTSNWE